MVEWECCREDEEVGGEEPKAEQREQVMMALAVSEPPGKVDSSPRYEEAA